MQQLTILFADLAGSTKLYQTEGDARAHQLISNSLARMKEVVEQNNGTLLRTVGDAVLASFPSTEDAFHGAVGIQLAHNNSLLSLRVGFHYGEVIPDKGDLYGNAVNIAARVASFAKADEICITHDCLAQLPESLKSRTDFLDLVDFKGIDEPMSVYRVYWSNETTASHTMIITPSNLQERYSASQELQIKVNEEQIQLTAKMKSVTIGRGTDNDIVIDHKSTSRNHATIKFTHGRFLMKDNSTNGTYVDRSGRPLDFLRREEIILDQDGRIGFGWKPADDDHFIITFRLVVEEETA